MKTKILHGWRWALAITSTIALLGCLDEANNSKAQNASVDASVSATTSPPPPENVVQEEILPAKDVVPPTQLSPGMSEVIKLAQSGVGDEVILSYINKPERSFSPSVEEIVYLKDLGLSEPVLSALVRHTEVETSTQVVPPAETRDLSARSSAAPNAPSLVDPYATSVHNEPREAPLTPPNQIDINYFERTLSPYGTWVEVANYGRCWQPTVVIVNRNWRPYTDRGRWIYTTSGWYWQSDYSWGWAPFHYGRWYYDSGYGWVWVPDTTWGPAWVSWRYADDHCGWAPLPPSAYYDDDGFYYNRARVGISFEFGLRADFYTFLPTSRLCDRTPHRYYTDRSRNTTIYNNSVVINNYIRGNNNTIINEGVGRDRVAKVSRTPIRTVALRELPPTSSAISRADRVEGNTLNVFRPKVSSVRSSTPKSGMRQPVDASRPTDTKARDASPERNSRDAGSLTKTERKGVSRGEPVQSPRDQSIRPSPVPDAGAPSQSSPRPSPTSTVTRKSPKVESPQTEKAPSLTTPTEPRTREIPRPSETSRETKRNDGAKSDKPGKPDSGNTPSVIESPQLREAPLVPQARKSPQVESPRGERVLPPAETQPSGNARSRENFPEQRRGDAPALRQLPVTKESTPQNIPPANESPRLREAPLKPQLRKSPQVEAPRSERDPSPVEARPTGNARPSQNSAEQRRNDAPASRQLPAIQNPAARSAPSVNNSPRLREAPLVPQSSVRTEPQISAPRSQPRPVERPDRIDTSVPRSLRSMEPERRQPTFSAPENFNRGSSIQRAPAFQTPRVQEAPQPRVQQAPAPRIQPSQPVQRERGPDRSSKSQREKDKN